MKHFGGYYELQREQLALKSIRMVEKRKRGNYDARRNNTLRSA